MTLLLPQPMQWIPVCQFHLRTRSKLVEPLLQPGERWELEDLSAGDQIVLARDGFYCFRSQFEVSNLLATDLSREEVEELITPVALKRSGIYIYIYS